MSKSSNYIPPSWQERIRKLESVQMRARLAVYLIRRYKTLDGLPKFVSQRYTTLDFLAYWPPHTRKTFLHMHVWFLRTDHQYAARSRGLQESSNTICATQNNQLYPYYLGA